MKTSKLLQTLATGLLLAITLSIFAPLARGQSLQTLYSFPTSGNDGHFPYAGLVQGSDGNFYGTTAAGGPNDHGTVFKITPGGVLTTLVTFTGFSGANPGRNPVGGLVQGRSDGLFYGTTQDGGLFGLGTVYKMTSGGGLTVLHEFDATYGAQPAAGLMEDASINGNFYGTAQYGGPSSLGTVFRVTSGGGLTLMYNFTGTANGRRPLAGLVQGRSDGLFYGTTFGDPGVNNYGTVFKMDSQGVLTTLHAFNLTDGSAPQAGLVEDVNNNGEFYGTTYQGGANNHGTVFKVTSSGTFTAKVNFLGTDGSDPRGGLVQGSDGNFYGTTYQGGANNLGTLFKMTPIGTLTTLVAFNAINGDHPHAAMVLGSDGNFYGTTVSGGTAGSGTVFRFQPCAPAVMTIALYAGLTITGTVGCNYRIDYTTSLNPPAWIPLTTLTLSSSPFLYVDTAVVSGSRFYQAVLVP